MLYNWHAQANIQISFQVFFFCGKNAAQLNFYRKNCPDVLINCKVCMAKINIMALILDWLSLIGYICRV